MHLNCPVTEVITELKQNVWYTDIDCKLIFVQYNCGWSLLTDFRNAVSKKENTLDQLRFVNTFEIVLKR